MRILITGGAGYIGTELIYHLLKSNSEDELIIYDNLSRKNFNLFIANKFSSKNIHFIQGDLLDSRKLRKVLKDVDVIYHLAAKVSTPFASDDPHSFEQVNHWGTAELVYAVEESAVKHFIYLSSSSVYGATENPVTENSPTEPTTFYGISKLRGEKHVERLMNKFKVHVIRCGNVYGYSPSMRFDAVINRFVFEANFFNRISIHGNGKQKRGFVHIENVTSVLTDLISNPASKEKGMKKEIPSGIYNLVDRNLSVLEISASLKEIFPDMEFIFIDQHMLLRNLEVDTNLLLKKYIEIPETDFDDELKKFKEHFAF